MTDAEENSTKPTPTGILTFQFRYRWEGKAIRLAVGYYAVLLLKDARIAAAEMRELYSGEIDPQDYVSSPGHGTTLQTGLC